MSYDEDRERRSVHFRAIGAFVMGMIAAALLIGFTMIACKETKSISNELHERKC